MPTVGWQCSRIRSVNQSGPPGPSVHSELPNLPSGCGSLQRRVWQAVSRDSRSWGQQGPARTDTGLTPAYPVTPHGPFHLHEALGTTPAPSLLRGGMPAQLSSGYAADPLWYDCHSIHICKLTSAYKSSSSAAIRRSPFFQGRAEVTSLVLHLYIY